MRLFKGHSCGFNTLSINSFLRFRESLVCVFWHICLKVTARYSSVVDNGIKLLSLLTNLPIIFSINRLHRKKVKNVNQKNMLCYNNSPKPQIFGLL